MAEELHDKAILVPFGSAADLDDLIDQWHDGDDPRPLHEFLGMTHDEYATWVEQRSGRPNG